MSVPKTRPLARSREQTRASYDRLSRWYDCFARDEWKYTQAGLRMLDPGPGAAFLEIGPGTGRALARAAGLVQPTGQALGMDLSAGMLRKARQTVSRFAIQSDLCQGDGLRLPFASRSFDQLFMSFTLELFDAHEIPNLLEECARVLRPGGSLGVVALAKENRPAVRVYEWFHKRWPVLVDCRPIRVYQLLDTAGFSIQKSQRMVMWGLPVEIVLGRRT